MRVVEVMTTDVVTAEATWSLKRAARAMIESGISGLPVVDADEVLIGIVTEADFIETEAGRGTGRRRMFDTVFGDKQTRIPSTVEAVMTRYPIVVDRNTTIAEAARLMTDRRVKRLPVVDPAGRLDGIVSRADILVAFARDDEVIADAVERGVVRRILMLESRDVSVHVNDGVVALAGQVPNRSDAKLLEELVWRIEGVVRCDSNLVWSFDDVSAGPAP